MVMFLLSFAKGSKSAEGGKNPLADMDPGGPYPLADLDGGFQIRLDTCHSLKLWRGILDKIVIRSCAVRHYIALHGYDIAASGTI